MPFSLLFCASPVTKISRIKSIGSKSINLNFFFMQLHTFSQTSNELFPKQRILQRFVSVMFCSLLSLDCQYATKKFPVLCLLLIWNKVPKCHFLFFLKPLDLINAPLHHSFKMLVVYKHTCTDENYCCAASFSDRMFWYQYNIKTVVIYWNKPVPWIFATFELLVFI